MHSNELVKIQNSLNAPKNQFNKFGNYKYRNCEDILESVKPLLKEFNCQIIIKDEIKKHGKRFYVKATATLISPSGEVSSSAYAREPYKKKGMDESQITGAASSYARKYALGGLLLVDDGKDADSQDNTDNTKKHNKTVIKSLDQEALNLLNSHYSYFEKKVISCNDIDDLRKEYKLFKDKLASYSCFPQSSELLKDAEFVCGARKKELEEGKEYAG